MGYVYAIIALIALGGGGYGVWTCSEAIKGKEIAEGKAKEFEEAYGALAKAAREGQEARNRDNELARQIRARAIQAEAVIGRLEKELEDEKTKDRGVKDWAEQPIPLSMRVLLDRDKAASPGPTMPSPPVGTVGNTKP